MTRLWLALWLALGLAPAQAQVPVVFPAPSSPQAIPLTVGVSGTTATITATLSAYASKYTYLCGLIATSAATSPVTAVDLSIIGAGTRTLTFKYDYVNPGQGIVGIAFPGCIPTSTTSKAITVTLPGAGDSTTVDALSVWGYAN
jgi:hypothetical protein